MLISNATDEMKEREKFVREIPVVSCSDILVRMSKEYLIRNSGICQESSQTSDPPSASKTAHVESHEQDVHAQDAVNDAVEAPNSATSSNTGPSKITEELEKSEKVKGEIRVQSCYVSLTRLSNNDLLRNAAISHHKSANESPRPSENSEFHVESQEEVTDVEDVAEAPSREPRKLGGTSKDRKEDNSEYSAEDAVEDTSVDGADDTSEYSVESDSEDSIWEPRTASNRGTIDTNRSRCELCGKTFQSSNDLSRHLRIHTGEKPYICTRCPKRFRLKCLLTSHAKHIHDKTRHPCRECHKTFCSQALLRIHIKVHTGEKRHYECSVCFKKLRNYEGHRRHLRTHTGEKPNECELCHKRFISRHDLRKHCKTHRGTRDYVCEVCGKRFGSKHVLRTHSLVHTGEKKYLCEECGKGFARADTLRRHILVHTGEPAHECEECGQRFGQAATLRRHMLLHSGEKPHKCDICDTAFSQRSMLKGHLRTHAK